MTDVEFYFDFVSPYSWLALMQAERFAREHRVRWRLQPVVYAKLLDATGLVGPAEIDVKRQYTFHDVARAADAAGLPLAGPPAHPFRSLEALRVFCLFREDERALGLAVQLADAAWGAGRDLTDLAVLDSLVERAGLDSTDLAARIRRPETKQALRESTESALRRGVFGVPSFVTGGELFWGHDRLPQLAGRLAGRLRDCGSTARRMLARPRGADRRRS